jgi:hypothetical protein
MFTYHWLKKVDKEQWNRLGSQLGTMWSRSELLRLNDAPTGVGEGSDTVFVPLSLVINPDLVEGLMSKAKEGPNQQSTGPTSTPSAPMGRGDGLNTGMSLPSGEEVVNMATLPKNEFLDVIRAGGLPTERAK